MPVEVDVSGAVALFSDLKTDMKRQVEPQFYKRAAGEGEGIMKRHIRVVTGYLRNSVSSNASSSGASITASADYAKAVDVGTRPHDIYPRNARALVFAPAGAKAFFKGGSLAGARFSFGGGSVTTGLIFTKHVHHPGTTGAHFSDKTKHDLESRLPGIMSGIINTMIRRHR